MNYAEKGVISDGQIVTMHGFVLNLFLGSAHKVAYASLSVLGPVGLDVGELHAHEFLVESVEEGQEEVLLTLHPEVTISEIEGPGPCGALGKHEEVLSRSNEPKYGQPSQKDQCLSSRKTEVLIMRADLFGTAQFGVGAEGAGHSQKHGLC